MCCNDINTSASFLLFVCTSRHLSVAITVYFTNHPKIIHPSHQEGPFHQIETQNSIRHPKSVYIFATMKTIQPAIQT